eukprot:398378-Prymnesium_polylepis.2
MVDAIVATEQRDSAAAPSRSRAISFFRALAPSQAKLGGLYTSYFQLALPHAARLLQPMPRANTTHAAADPPGKRQKRADGSPTGAAAVAAAGEAEEAEAALCLRSALFFVQLGLTHGGASAAPLGQMHALEGPLLDQLASDDPPPVDGPLDRVQAELLATLAALVRALGAAESKRLHFELCHRTRAEET